MDTLDALAELVMHFDGVYILRRAYTKSLGRLVAQVLYLFFQLAQLLFEVALQRLAISQQAAADDQRGTQRGELQDIDGSILNLIAGQGEFKFIESIGH